MNFARTFLIGSLLLAPCARATYAPVPDRNEGKVWSASLRAAVGHDSNIFGSSSGARASTVWTVAPRAAFNGSLTDTTFATASYQLTSDTFENRPGDKTVLSHDVFLRLAHAFTSATNLDVSDSFQIAKNPETLLSGIPVNAGQAYQRNQLDGRLNTTLGQQTGLQFKVRRTDYSFENDALARDIDRTENLYGLALSYDAGADAKLIGEYRHQDVLYRHASANKDKRSEFLLGGLDYQVAKKISLGARLGYEWRSRDAERSLGSPYAEFTAKYDYAPQSFLAGGYSYTIEETSNIVTFTDSRVHRVFFNVQHALSAFVIASSSVSYDSSTLEGRRGFRSVDETALRAGAALNWLPTKNWMLSATIDSDKVDSDEPVRGQTRMRYGVGATYSF